jgi:hypothetical protein
MKIYHDAITPPAVERHPELPVLCALDHLLEMTSVTLCAHYPEILPPDWPLGSLDPPEPAAYVANLLLALAEALRNVTRVYHETIARDLAGGHPPLPEEDQQDGIPF